MIGVVRRKVVRPIVAEVVVLIPVLATVAPWTRRSYLVRWVGKCWSPPTRLACFTAPTAI